MLWLICPEQGDQMIWKKSCRAKLQNMFLNNLFRWKCDKFVAQGIAFFGSSMNIKSSLIGEKLPNPVTLVLSKNDEEKKFCEIGTWSSSSLIFNNSCSFLEF